MLIGSLHTCMDVFADDCKLQIVNAVKYCQVQSVSNSVCSRLYAIRRLQPLPSSVTSLLYKAFVLPITDYCDVVWFSGLVNMLKRIH